MTHPAHYIEVLMLDHPDSRERALTIGRSLITPLLAADTGSDAMDKLRFWSTLIAFLLGVAEASVGADGREAIVQTMRNVPASNVLAKMLANRAVLAAMTGRPGVTAEAIANANAHLTNCGLASYDEAREALADLLALVEHAAGNGFDAHPDNDARVLRARAVLAT